MRRKAARKPTRYRLVMLFLSLGCLAGAGWIAYRTYFAAPGHERLLAQAKKRYADGAAAEKANRPADAAALYDEAFVHTNGGIEAVVSAVQAGRLPADDGRKLLGQFWLARAQATRDREYAKALAAGAPLMEPDDTTLNVKYRSYLAVPDADDRGRSVADLRYAFGTHPDDPALAKELIRVELSIQPINWADVAKVCRVLVKESPTDPRANYCLAREEFQQGGPRLSDKTSDQVERARGFLDTAIANKAPYWRAEWLKLQILRARAEAARGRGKDGEKLAAELTAELFGADGPLAKAADGFALTRLSSLDSEGLLALHPFAVQVLLADRAAPPDPKLARQACDSAVAFGRKMAEMEAAAKDQTPQPSLLPQVGAAVATAVRAAAPALARAADDRAAVSLAARDFFDKHPTAVTGPAALPVALLAADEATAARDRRDPAAPEFHARAVARLDAGLTAATEQKQTDAQVEFREALLLLKSANGEPAEALEPHIAALRASGKPRAKALAELSDAERAATGGRPSEAQRRFAAVLADPAAAEFALRARAGLAAALLTAGDPAAAGHLQPLADALRSESLPRADRDRLTAAFGSADELTAIRVRAIIDAGFQRLAREQQAKPDALLPLTLRDDILRPAAALARTLPVSADKAAPSPDRAARIAVAEYHARTGNRERAGKILTDLAADYPTSGDVARARAEFVRATSEAEADAIIDQFASGNAGRAGQLFRAEWFAATGRGTDAANAPTDPADRATARLLAGGWLTAAPREEVAKLLAALPTDPTTDPTLLRAAARRLDPTARNSALSRFECDGPLRLLDATEALAAGKFHDALPRLAALTETASVRRAVRDTLHRAAVAFAGTDPSAAPFLLKLAADAPDEPAAYLGLALAAVLAGDIGQPTDNWPTAKTMYAAANRWEQLAVARAGRPGLSPVDVGRVRLRFHELAGNPLAARADGVALLSRAKDDVPLLLAVAGLYLADPDPQPAEAKKHLTAAYQLSPPDSVLLLATEARLKERTNDPAGAVAVYERMAVQFPADGTAYAHLTRLAAARGHAAEAAKWAKAWTEKQPDSDLAALEWVARTAAVGDKAEAVAAGDALVKKATERARKAAEDAKEPKDAADHRATAARAAASRQLAEALLRGNAPDEAEKVYRALLAEDATDQASAAPLVRLLVGKNATEALAVAAKARERKGSDAPAGADQLRPEFLDAIGGAYAAGNKDTLAEMKALFDAAVRQYPTDPRMHFWQATATAALGDSAKAHAGYRAAVRLCERPTAGLSDADRTALRARAEAKLPKAN